MKKLGSVAALFSTLLLSYGQGTVQFSTGPSTRVQYTGMNGIESVPPGFPVFYGLFVGHTADSLSLITPLAESSATVAGQIEVNGATAMLYVIPGFGANTQPFLQVRAWSSSFGTNWQAAFAAAASTDPEVFGGVFIGQTDVVQSEPLGANTGPGTPIWQSAGGTDPNRFTPLLVVTPIPEPSTIALCIMGGLVSCLVRLRTYRD